MREPRFLADARVRVRTRLRPLLGCMQSPRAQAALYWLSVVSVVAVAVSYLSVWTAGNWAMLTDPALQNSDARTSIFPFHRYDPVPSLEADPISQEMLTWVPALVHLLYRVLVPLTDVHVAPKIVQALCVAIILWAAVILGRSRRAGLGAAALLLFVVLHDWFTVYRLASGLPRAFGFPLFALWLSGCLAARPWVRRGAILALALTYPSVMNLILAAEGIYACRGLGTTNPVVVLRRLKRYALLVGCCVLVVLPAALGNEKDGPVHTLEQAEREPAFGRSGRLAVLPFPSPTGSLSDAFIDPLRPRGQALVPKLAERYAKDKEMSAVVLIGLILLVPLFSLTAPPWLALAFASGSVVLYALSRTFAFRLYSPERYYSFGMRMALMALLIVILAQSFAFLRGRSRRTVRNFVAVAFILTVWSSVGSGIVRNNGMTIDRRRDRGLYEFIAKLPSTVRIASHPMDGDGVPYYSARATMGSYETLQPWFVDSWRRQRSRTEDTLRALYSDDLATILTYVRRHHVTHFLLDKRKYKKDAAKRSASFEPFTTFSRRLLEKTKPEKLYFRNVPDDAIVYEQGHWLLVEVARLTKVRPERALDDEPEE